ncbi:DNRLRE domain-containing protein, partial [Clostridium sp. A1-XYC3]
MGKHKKANLVRQNSANLSQSTVKPEVINPKRKKKRIIGEVKEKRQKNVKHFLKEDLTFEAAIYNEDVHYYSDGQWKDIDNSIIDGKDEENNDVFENKENDIKIKIAKKVKNKKLVTIKKDKYEISWGIDKASNSDAKVKGKEKSRSKREHQSRNKSSDKKVKYRQQQDEGKIIEAENLNKKTLKNISSTVEFPNVYPNIDLQYTIISNNLKESIIIKSKVDNPVFTFNLNVKNLVPKLQQDYTIIFYDDKDTSKAVFKFDPPFMYDGNGETSKDIKITLVEDKKGYNLSWTPNNDWLKDANRKYPVTIDPTISTPQEAKSIFDSYISSNYPNSNYGKSVALRVGKFNDFGVTRSFISFTLPTDKLTSGDLVVGAYLNLNLAILNYDKRQVNVYKVMAPWDPASINWSNAPAVNDKRIEDYQLVNDTAGKWVAWDITRVVKEWLRDGANYGLMLRNSDENASYNQFFSSDVSDYDEYGNNLAIARPVIAIQYVNNSGLENYWTYHSQDVGRAGTGYVNDFNGNLVFIHNDVSMSGSKMPITLNHVFNSNEKDIVSGYGNGWR